MSKSDLNLKYATQKSAFFSGLNVVKEKVAPHIALKKPFDDVDESEISRAKTYAVFPELLKQNEEISIENFREVLAKKGIDDELFQNKILIMLLQNRAGIQYRLGSNILDVFQNRGGIFTLNEEYELEINIIGKNSVDLTYKARINEKDPWTASASEAFRATVIVNISPEKVIIKDFNISKVHNSDSTNKAFMAIQREQQNILMKLLTYIKYALGFDSEIRIDKTQEEPSNNNLSL